MSPSPQQNTSSECNPSVSSMVLPDDVEAIRGGLVISAQANAVVAALFAGIQAQLLSGIPDNTNTPLINALTLFSYVGLVSNIGASLSAMGLLDYLGDVPDEFRLSHFRGTTPSTQILPTASTHAATISSPEAGLKLLISHKGDPRMKTSYVSCHISLLLGTVCLVIQIALFAWLKSQSVAVFVVIIITCLISIVTSYVGHVVVAFLSGLLGCGSQT